MKTHALCILGLSLAAPTFGQTFFGFDHLNNFHTGGVGDRLISFDHSDPANPTVIGETGISTQQMVGLEIVSGTLYAFGQSNGGVGGTLYTIDMTTAAPTALGSGGLLPLDSCNDLAFNSADGRLYGIGHELGGLVALYRFDLNTGVASVFATLSAPAGTNFAGLAIEPGTGRIFVLDTAQEQIFEVQGNALVPLPGAIGFDAQLGQGMGFDPLTGKLYLGAFNSTAFAPELREGNLATGSTTLLGTIGGFTPGGVPEHQLGDIAVIPSHVCNATVYCTGPNQVGDIEIDYCRLDGQGNTLTVRNANEILFAYFLVGAGSAPVNPPGSWGNLCLANGGPIGRYNLDLQVVTGGVYSTDIYNGVTGGGAGNMPLGGMLTPGATWNFQAWQRTCCGMPATWSTAISVTFE